METSIEYKGKLYIFKKPPNLTDKMFQDRSWFIVKNKNLEHVESYADLWICWKYYGSEYGRELMDFLVRCETKMMD